jgi:ubiquinone/menaquinone biosynthesis C-methylase UbiE
MEAGIDIDGVDNSPEMLAICRQKADALGLAPNLYEGYMESLELPRKYRTILVPSSSLQLIMEPVQAERALKRLLAHLTPGGGIAASIMTLWREGDPLESEWDKSAVREVDGAEFRRHSWSRYTPASECEDTQDLYQKVVGGMVVAEEKHQRSPATRSYTQVQARALFERAGFGRVELYSEFTFDPVQPEDTMFVVIGQR